MSDRRVWKFVSGLDLEPYTRDGWHYQDHISTDEITNVTEELADFVKPPKGTDVAFNDYGGHTQYGWRKISITKPAKVLVVKFLLYKDVEVAESTPPVPNQPASAP